MTINMLTTAQVAAKLGVKPQTIYAYVSRGVLSRTLTDDGRESRFDPAEVEALVERGRPRRGEKPAGRVTVSIHSAVTELAPDGLRYRGHRVSDLCEQASFEQVAHLLWTGRLPAGLRFEQRPVPSPVAAALGSLAPWASPIERFTVALSVGACVDPPLLRGLPGPEVGEGLIDLLLQSLPVLGKGAQAAPKGGVAERLWPRLSTHAATRSKTRLLDTALCLLADHELATSTLSVRVAASTRPDLHAALLAGLSTVSGVLHGRAASALHRILLEGLRTGHPEQAMREFMAGGVGTGGVPGFGHPVYEDGDGRCSLLLEGLKRLRVSQERRAVWERTLTAGQNATGRKPNVDFALGAFAFCTGMAPEAASAIFALARSAGWIAHALEEFEQLPLRYRGRALYVGA